MPDCLDRRYVGALSGSCSADEVHGEGLVGAWRDAAASAGWVAPDEWWHPAVDALAAALLVGTDPTAATRRLGRARADLGVSLGDALADLATLHGLVTGGLPPLDHALVLAKAHGQGLLERLSGRLHEDPATHLVPMAYLCCRLADAYRTAAADGETVADVKVLVVLAHRPESHAVLEQTGGAVRGVFDRGETCAQVGEGRVVVLADRSPRLPRDLRRLRERLAAVLPGTTDDRVWVQPLRATYETSIELVDHLAACR